ncbi:ABC transporter permease [Jonesia quinghaiensis]|uniref:ABC transporter permease n=1 Tax=Jonesia quinghaiensis TaxID=262806 RepID=UPI0004273971|nr:ABC transporter permease [Jonesia quinghaiensis]
MIAVVTSEYRKLFSTRMWWVLLIVMAAYMGLTATMLAAMFGLGESAGLGTSDAPLAILPDEQKVASVYTTAVSFGYVFPAIIGVMSFGGEFRHKTITDTLLAVPNRTQLLGAKLISALPMGLMYGLIGTASCVAFGGAVFAMTGIDPLLTTVGTWEIIGRSVLALTLWLITGVALGALLTNQITAIVVLLVFTQFLEPILRIVLPRFSWGQNITQYLPGAAGDSIAGGSFFNTVGASLLPMWQGVVILLAYTVVFAVVGRMTSLARDIS